MDPLTIPSSSSSSTCNNSNAMHKNNQGMLLPEPEPFHLVTSPVSSAGFPSVFEESRDMLLSAILMYGLIDLRQLARDYEKNQPDYDVMNDKTLNRNDMDDNNIINSDTPYQKFSESTKTHTNTNSISTLSSFSDRQLIHKLLTLPISAKDIVRLMARHRREIEESYIGKDATAMYLTVLDELQATSSSRELELEFFQSTADCGRNIALVDFSIVAVQDSHLENELVYAICVDTARRRITVMFRGCSTKKDWAVCANNILKEQVNPLFEKSRDDANMMMTRQPATIAIHSGYCSYLFNASKQASGVSKFDEIVAKLKSLLQEYPGYRVYATGHSLGAALSTVFSFQVAATQCLADYLVNEEQQAISCINFASPMVGNLGFETAFLQLEAEGKLRCLRVTNDFDIFTQLPDRSNWLYVVCGCAWGIHLVWYLSWALVFFLCCQSRVYRHVGMDLHMYKRRNYRYLFRWNKDTEPPHWFSYKIKHSRGTTRSFAWRVAQDWKKHLKQAIQRTMSVPFVMDFNTNHSAKEHLLRLQELANDLEGIYLQDLYDTKRFPLVSKGSSPKGPAPPPPMTACEAFTSNSCFV